MSSVKLVVKFGVLHIYDQINIITVAVFPPSCQSMLLKAILCFVVAASPDPT